MNPSHPFEGRSDHLRRLTRGYYQGEAMVHWAMTMENRKTGWLCGTFHAEFREILFHTLFRYELLCPIYCCMPDHFHLLWVGFRAESDQWLAVRFFRKFLNAILGKEGFALQREAYDHVLRSPEKDAQGFKKIVDYIAANPERANLVNREGGSIYPYMGSLIPGYPDLHWGRDDFWDRFWMVKANLSHK